jgi:FAD/FMN-containing dehydrogenase
MDRRTLLKRLAVSPLLPRLWVALPTLAQTAVPSKSSARRVRPSDPSWPSTAAWEKLKQQVGGHFIQVQSPLAACESASDTASCHDVLKNLQNPYYIGDQPGGTQTSGWVDGWTPAPSAYAVAVRHTADVVAAVNFARENNLLLVVKGGGHSYQGTSNAADSLLIWTRAMNNITLHDAFIAQGCAGMQAAQPAVTIEAGAMWMDVYHAVTTIAGRYVQGGGCATVGVAGLIQSGGFGSFSKNYGMAASGLLEAEVVTADGAVRTANACTNPDLFWGIKGGGGGSLGVVTKVTLRTRELPAFFGRVRATIKASSDAAFHRLIGQFVGFYNRSLFNPHWGESVAFGPDNTFTSTMSFQGPDEQQAHDVWQGFFDWAARSPQDFTVKSAPRFEIMPARKYWDAEYIRKNLPDRAIADSRPGAPENHVWWTGNQIEVGIFIHGYESAWLPASLLKGDQQKRLTDALFASSRHWEVALHFNKGLAGAPSEAIAAARETAMNPAVLNAFALAIIASGEQHAYPGIRGHEPDIVVARKEASAVNKSMDELRKIVPDAGSYVSEGNFFDGSWQQSFWGPNYARLQNVKAKYDPEGLFFVHHGVGSEDWSADGFIRLAGR